MWWHHVNNSAVHWLANILLATHIKKCSYHDLAYNTHTRNKSSMRQAFLDDVHYSLLFSTLFY